MKKSILSMTCCNLADVIVKLVALEAQRNYRGGKQGRQRNDLCHMSARKTGFGNRPKLKVRCPVEVDGFELYQIDLEEHVNVLASKGYRAF